MMASVISPKRKQWTTMISKSVSFMTGYQEEILSVTVPLADQETTGTVSTDDLEMTLSMPTQI